MDYSNEKLSVKQRIINVLLENENDFMTTQEIAEIGYGPEAYIRDSRNALNAKVKRNMYQAVSLATELGFLMIPKKTPTKLNPDKGHKITGWKIAGIEDKENVDVILNDKMTRAGEYYQASLSFGDNVITNKILEKSNVDETLKVSKLIE